MIIINTTYQVAVNLEEDWIGWIRNIYIPAVTKSGMLAEPRLYKLFTEQEDGAVSYALQFEVESFDILESWSEKYGDSLRTSLSDKYQDKILGFTTLMEKLDLI